MKTKRLGVTCAVAAVAALASVAPAGGNTFDGRNGKIAFGRASADWQRFGLFTVSRDGKIDRLTWRNDGAPTWSPDGSQIAFVRWTDTGSRIYVMNADGTGRRPIGQPSAPGCGMQPARWSYDGLFIAYAEDCFDHSPRVAQIRVSTAAGDSEIAITDSGSLNVLSSQPWSPDLENSSRLVYVTDKDGDFEVVTVNADGTEPLQLTNDAKDQFEPVWSPAGPTVVYSTQTVKGTRATNDLWAKPATGGPALLLEEGAPHSNEAQWSPDGTRLLFSRRDRNGYPTAVVVNADGTGAAVLGEGLEPAEAAWAPNGTAVVLTHDGDIVRVRVSDGARRRLTDNEMYDGMPGWQARPPAP